MVGLTVSNKTKQNVCTIGRGFRSHQVREFTMQEDWPRIRFPTWMRVVATKMFSFLDQLWVQFEWVKAFVKDLQTEECVSQMYLYVTHIRARMRLLLLGLILIIFGLTWTRAGLLVICLLSCCGHLGFLCHWRWWQICSWCCRAKFSSSKSRV